MKAPRRISNSQLTEFKKSPKHWKHYVEKKKTQTDAMVLGSLAHCLALEKETFEEQFYLLDLSKMPHPEKDFRTKANAEWKEVEISSAGSKMIVSSEMLDKATKMVTSLYEDEVAIKYLRAGKEFESRLEWSCMGLDFLGIRDITSDEFIVDLKFVRDADPFAFRRYLFNSGLYRQGGMYLDGEMGGEFTGDPHKRVLFIACENDEPFGVSVHELDAETISWGINEYRMLSQQLKMCLDNEYFPSYSHRSINGSFDATIPTYAMSE